MTVNNIKLEGFRNYISEETCFSDNVNVIIGDNAQGKTNLLEAIYYMTSGHSFRSRFDKEIIGFDSNSAIITADIFSDERKQKLKAVIPKNGRKQFFAGGVKLKTAAELSGKLTAVLFCPDDLYMIKSGGAQRRRMMNMCLTQLRPRYASALTAFNKTYEHKTRILKDWREKRGLLETFDDFSYHLAALSAELIYYRANFIKAMSERASQIYDEISGGRERLELCYKTVKTIPDPCEKPSVLLPFILRHQEEHKRAELESGMCLTGAHKDDIEILIDGISAKNFASQGQTRSAVLSMKLAERDIHYRSRGEYPLLLLDDVLSELDRQRQDFILNRITEGQIFITCCEDNRIAEATGGRVLSVRKGVIS